MRRVLAIVLLAIFGLPLIQPLLASTRGTESNLPVCCRRDGAHHCAMSAEEASALLDGKHFTTAPVACPMFPRALAVAHHAPLFWNESALLFAEVVSHPALHRQTEAWARVALEGARHKRGPPVELV